MGVNQDEAGVSREERNPEGGAGYKMGQSHIAIAGWQAPKLVKLYIGGFSSVWLRRAEQGHAGALQAN